MIANYIKNYKGKRYGRDAREFLCLVDPLGLEDIRINPEKTRKVYKMWKKCRRKQKWESRRRWFMKYILRKSYFVNKYGDKISLK